MADIDDILTYLNENNFKSDDIKKNVVQALSPYFLDISAINKFWTTPELLTFFSFLITYGTDKKLHDDLLEVLSHYRKAFLSDEQTAFSIFDKGFENFSNIENMMSSMKTKNKQTILASINSVEDLNKNEIFDLFSEIMDYIGKIIDLSITPQTREIWALISIHKSKQIDFEKIKLMKFGILVQNIIDANTLRNIYLPGPLGIRLSDWRNISYHHDYVINDNSVTCSYKDKQFTLTINELSEHLHFIVRSLNILYIARLVISFDNSEKFVKYKTLNNPLNTNLIDRVLASGLKTSLLTQQFRLEEVTRTEDCVTITVFDLSINSISKDENMERRIQSSQFLFQVWSQYRSKKVEVKYSTLNDGKCFSSSIESGWCESFSNGDISIEELASKVKFTKLIKTF